MIVSIASCGSFSPIFRERGIELHVVKRPMIIDRLNNVCAFARLLSELNCSLALFILTLSTVREVERGFVGSLDFIDQL